MGQRKSEYERVEHEHYPTPAWVIDALYEHMDLRWGITWEPACGSGQMAGRLMWLSEKNYCYSTDIHDHGADGMDRLFDFLSDEANPLADFTDIVTTPPYGPRGKTAAAFIEKGLDRIGPGQNLALLLPSDFDAAKTRRKFFADCPYFVGRITLTKRIKWFDGPSSPSVNHAWFIWAKPNKYNGDPRIWYAPTYPKEAAE